MSRRTYVSLVMWVIFLYGVMGLWTSIRVGQISAEVETLKRLIEDMQYR